MSVGALNIIPGFICRFFKSFQKPLPIQVAALCYRDTAKGREVLLITSRKGKRWILPKGNPINGLTNAQAAQQEAYEEAGVRGTINEQSIGKVQTTKNHGNGFRSKIELHVYALSATSQETDFPEKGQRITEWMNISSAIERCDEDAISFLLESWGAQKH